jgi:hypothetical protein
MATTEHTINDALAGLLRATSCSWRNSHVVTSENTGMLKDSQAQPDILIVEPNVSPVVIETEVLPAATVQSDAIARLGEKVRVTGRTILSSVAMRLPVRLRSKQGASLRNELANANDIELALYSDNDPSRYIRWPLSGWIPGNISDLSLLVQSASVPPDVVDEAANELVSGVRETAGLMTEMYSD